MSNVKNKQLISDHPELSQIYGDKNSKPAEHYTIKQKVEVWWKCPRNKEHSEELRRIDLMARRSNYKCDQCKESYWISSRPEMMKIWHKDNILDPSKRKTKSENHAYWNCELCQNRFKRIISKVWAKVSKGIPNICLSCTKKIPSEFYNLETEFPEIAKELDEIKTARRATEILPHSNDNAFWVCGKCKWSWSARINSRTTDANGCPYCSGRVATADRNILTEYPMARLYWNDPRPIESFLPWSSTPVKWKCPNAVCQREYTRAPRDVTRLRGSLCPYCNPAGQSVLQKRLYHEFHAMGLDMGYREIINNQEADIHLTEHGIIIEIDGRHWHKNKESRDLKKWQIFQDEGFTTINLREEGLPPVSANDVVFNDCDGASQIMLRLCRMMMQLKPQMELAESMAIYKKGECLADKALYADLLGMEPLICRPITEIIPEINSRWSSKNKVPPHHISRGSTQTVWLKCPNGLHGDFSSTAYNVKNTWNSKYSGCPACDPKGLCKPDESIAHTHPEVAKRILEFHDPHHPDRTINNTRSSAGCKATFHCECGSRKRPTVRSRAHLSRTLGCGETNPATGRRCYKDAPLNPYYGKE